MIFGAETTATTGGIGGGDGEPPTPGIPLEDIINISEGTYSGDCLLLVSIESVNWRSCFSYESDIKGESEWYQSIQNFTGNVPNNKKLKRA